MNLILDTHVFLWWRLDSSRLKRDVRKTISTTEVVMVSAASAWEVAIKQGLGRLRLQESFAAMVEDSEFEELPITSRHAERAGILPLHHTDPFDRMLIAQASLEGATVVTHDRHFRDYDVPILWV
jgi:PIN domain nuclease of toxin-antitoxin system